MTSSESVDNGMGLQFAYEQNRTWAIDWPKTGTDGALARGPGISARAWHTGSSGASSASSRPAPPPIEQPFRFQGQQFDEETELHYNRFRYYDPAIGWFVSQDPIGLRGGQHLSVYAPNPLTLSDPLGLDYRSTFWDAVGGLGREKYQVHHIIPQAIYDKHAVARLTSIEPPPKLVSHNFSKIEDVFPHWSHTISKVEPRFDRTLCQIADLPLDAKNGIH